MHRFLMDDWQHISVSNKRLNILSVAAAAPASSTSALNGKVIVGVGAWTPGQTSEKRGGPAGRGNPFDGSLQALVATLLVDLLILVLVCEYGTSSLCVWCTL